jgi:hypothetical protein
MQRDRFLPAPSGVSCVLVEAKVIGGGCHAVYVPPSRFSFTNPGINRFLFLAKINHDKTV